MPSTIFVLDDEPGILNLVRFTLEDAGYTVHGAANGKEANAVCERFSAECDAGVFDIEVPGMTLASLDSLVRAYFPKKGVVFMSGYPEDATDELSAETRRWSEFLKKPFFPQDLLAVVRRAIARAASGGDLTLGATADDRN